MGSRAAARAVDFLVAAVLVGLLRLVAGPSGLWAEGGFVLRDAYFSSAASIWLVSGVIEVGLLGLVGQTPGKRAMQIHALDPSSGKPIGIIRSLMRFIVLWSSPFVVLLLNAVTDSWVVHFGWLSSPVVLAWALLSPQTRGLHDVVSGSVVVSSSRWRADT